MFSQMIPGKAHNWLKALRALLHFAKVEGFRPDNPMDGLKPAKHKTESRHAWTAEEIAQYEAHYPIGTKECLAFALLLFTGQRPGDMLSMGRQHIRDGAIYVTQQKTGTRLAIPVHPDLEAVLDATPSPHLTFVTLLRLQRRLRSWCDAAGLPQECTAHRLRHARAHRLLTSGRRPTRSCRSPATRA